MPTIRKVEGEGSGSDLEYEKIARDSKPAYPTRSSSEFLNLM